jgi:hypothetical protein
MSAARENYVSLRFEPKAICHPALLICLRRNLTMQ